MYNNIQYFTIFLIIYTKYVAQVICKYFLINFWRVYVQIKIFRKYFQNKEVNKNITYNSYFYNNFKYTFLQYKFKKFQHFK